MVSVGCGACSLVLSCVGELVRLQFFSASATCFSLPYMCIGEFFNDVFMNVYNLARVGGGRRAVLVPRQMYTFISV